MPPHSLQCYYLPWTNCTVRANSDVENISLHAFHRSKKWYGWSKLYEKQLPPAHKVLFRPRPHVISHANTVQTQCQNTSYWTIHIRNSPEKQAELHQKFLPTSDDYFNSLPRGIRHVLIQTANPICYARARALCAMRNLICCATEFPRHVNDIWGGRNKTLVDETGLTGAVNGELGRRGEGLVSLGSSMWNSSGSTPNETMVCIFRKRRSHFDIMASGTTMMDVEVHRRIHFQTSGYFNIIYSHRSKLLQRLMTMF